MVSLIAKWTYNGLIYLNIYYLKDMNWDEKKAFFFFLFLSHSFNCIFIFKTDSFSIVIP